jgi:hypothetical protein
MMRLDLDDGTHKRFGPGRVFIGGQCVGTTVDTRRTWFEVERNRRVAMWIRARRTGSPSPKKTALRRSAVCSVGPIAAEHVRAAFGEVQP